MQTLAVLALILEIVLLLRPPGHPVRRSSEEKRSTAQSPEADIPPPDTFVIL